MYHTKTSFSSGWAALGWAELGSVTLQNFITREFLDKRISLGDSILTRGWRDSTDSDTSAFLVHFWVDYLFSLIRLPFD